MNTVFIGGSRQISRLSPEVKDRLNRLIHRGHRIVIGDANGADKAVQRYLQEAAYDKVTVFCSGENFRNNLGQWATHKVEATDHAKGFKFYAAKDREMAREADFGLMIWDGKSSGTILNVLRLVRAGKRVVLVCMAEKRSLDIETEADWEAFLSRCDDGLLRDLRARATVDEWQSRDEAGHAQKPEQPPDEKVVSEFAASLRTALVAAKPAAILEALGGIAKARGMGEVARRTGLSRESLYRALSTDGNPEFATVLKVIASLGLRLEVSGLPTAANPARSPDDYCHVPPSQEQEAVTRKSAEGRTRKPRKGRSSRAALTAPPQDLLL